jgi:alkylation response protein AidB-like acyl-CoA dehydrogenase
LNFELKAITEQGRRYVTLCEQHATDFALRAGDHDRKGTFAFENIEDLKGSGVMGACAPEDLGGLGIESVHDFAVGISRLGRGDGSTAIASTMHMFRPWRLTRRLKAMRNSDDAAASSIAASLRDMSSGKTVVAALLSEAGTDLVHPLVEATRTDGGWLLNGRKIFGTLCEAATVFEITCRFKDTSGDYQRAIATVPSDAKGLEIQNDWDAMGMRASGSHSVSISDCFVPESALVVAGPWGVWNEGILVSTGVINLALVAAFLGIAEQAHDNAMTSTKGRRRGSDQTALADSPAIQHGVAEMEIDLAAARAMLERSARSADDYLSTHADSEVILADLLDMAKDIQVTKWFVTRKAVDIVDKAMTLSGGSGYLGSNTLSRLYRDVRAGPFMQPFSPNEAFEFIGKVSLDSFE